MNIPIIDLHSHSNISDGLLTPADLMFHAAENNVQAIALTDHDDIAGLEEASHAAKKLNIIFKNPSNLDNRQIQTDLKERLKNEYL